MKVKTLRDYGAEVLEIKRALRIGASMAEYRAVVKKYGRQVRLEIPLGEVVGNLKGFAWAWKMQGMLGPVEPIVDGDKFNAQGLEGKVSIEMSLYDALFVAMQAAENRVQIRE